MLKVKPQLLQHKMTGVIVSAETLLEHIFLIQMGEEVALKLKKDFLYRTNTPELRMILEGRIAEEFVDWRASGKHGYNELEIEEMEKIVPTTGDNMQEAVLDVIRKVGLRGKKKGD